MKRRLKDLLHFSIGATDSNIGEVKDFYFDSHSWTIRYLIVDTGNWLAGRKVLISPQALKQPEWDSQTFPANLTKEQVKNSPDIDTQKPVSQQQEMMLYEYYPWGSYWGGGLWNGGIGTAGMLMNPSPPLDEAVQQNAKNVEQQHGDPHLHSYDTVKGFQIRASDGNIGDVEDFIIDDHSWKIHFLIIDTGNWLPGKKVVVSAAHIRNIEWETSSVFVDLTVGKVKNSPGYDPDQSHQDEYYQNLDRYYGGDML